MTSTVSMEGPATRRQIAPAAVAVALVVVPLVAALLVALRLDWHPASDHALVEARVRDLLDGRAQLTGPFSRFGYDHPGPLLFWVLAVPYRLLGDDPRGLLVGAVLVNLAAAVSVVRAAAARSGRFALATAVAVNVLVWTQVWNGAVLLPWNPYVAVLPFLALLCACWRAADGSAPALVAVVLSASWVLQNHVGYTLLAVGCPAVAVALGGRRLARGDRRWVWGAGALAVLLWAPVLVDQVAGTGNAGAIVEWAADPGEVPLGLGGAVRVAGQQLLPRATWSGATGATDTIAGGLVAGPWLQILVPVVALVLVNDTALRERDSSMVRFVVVVGVGIVVGVVSLSRVVGIVAPYVALWLRPLAATVWLLAAWAVWARVRPWVPPRVGWATIGVVSVASCALALGGVVAQPAPWGRGSDAVVELSAQLRPQLDPEEPVVVQSLGLAYLVVGTGLQMSLERAGFDAFEPAPDDPDAKALVGEHRQRSVSEGDVVLLVLAGADDVAAAEADPALEIVARAETPDDPVVVARRR